MLVRLSTMKPRLQKNVSIPIDLLIEIFLKLPAKSIARFCSVSKLWASVLRRQDFTESFFTKSSARPQLLFACQGNKDLFFFSANQPQNPDENSIIANRLAHFPIGAKFLLAPVNGFFILSLEDEKILNGRKYTESVSVICNPSTGQSFTLPKGKTRRKVGVGSYLGYDPIEKLFKVLSMTWLTGNWISEEHQVMTIGTESSWKMVECCVPHLPTYHYGRYGCGICINGVLYYLANHEGSMILSFDFRSKEFHVLLKATEAFNGVMSAMPYTTTLINYNGKLGLLMSDDQFYVSVSGTSRNFELWILEDVGKHEWSKHIYVLPPLWNDVVGKTVLYFVGVIGTNEIVLAPHNQSMPTCYIFYYNTERETIKRVEIQGSEAFKFKGCSVRTYLNYVDNVMLIPEL